MRAYLRDGKGHSNMVSARWQEVEEGTGLGGLVRVSESRNQGKPIHIVKRAWRAALEKVGVSYSPIYDLRHVFDHSS